MSVSSPLVSRSVRVGAVLIALGVIQFTAAMVVVQATYPGYSDLTNYISDLGNTTASPWHVVFNVSIIVLGLLAFVGILIAWSGFPRGATRVVGLGLLLVASIGAIGVGLFPENVDPTVHSLASLTVFGPGGVALVVLAAGMRRGTSWHWFREASAVLGLITIVSLLYYVPTDANATIWNAGLIERFIVAPILIWGFVAAVHLARLPRLAATGRPNSA